VIHGLTGFALALVCLLRGASSLAGDECAITFDDKGLSGIVHNGVTLVHPDDPRFRVQCLCMGDATDRAGLQRLDRPQPVKSAFDGEKKALRLEYNWGKVDCVFTVGKGRLDLLVSLTNTAPGPIPNCVFVPFELDLPDIPQNAGEWDHPRQVRPAAFQEGSGDVVGHLYLHSRGAVGVVGDAFLFFKDGSPHGSRPVCAPGPDPAAPLPSGRTASYRVSLVFGPPRATLPELAPDVYAEYVKANPVVLSWADRRPIALAFLCNSNCGLKTNPRGWFQAARDVDVTTEEGVRAFGERLLLYADNCIGRMKAMNAQAIIVWDIEGQEMPHMTSYIGDPRPLAKLSPEMDRFADAFMKKFRDAGFKTGITIRPTEIFQSGAGRWSQRGVVDPVATMSEKIEYAQKRWGCTIFYLDSDFLRGGILPSYLRIPWVLPASSEKLEPSIKRELAQGVMPAEMLEKLAKLHPDCLISPEFSSRDFYRFSAPYSSPNLDDGGTDPVIRGVWPQAFRLVAVNSWQMAKNWEHFADSVEKGDVLLFPGWFDALENTFVKLLYREAELRRKGALTALATADLPTLLAKARDPAEETRYAAAAALGNAGKAEAVAPLAALLKDGSPLVRKQALAGLARLNRIEDPACIGLLLEWIRNGRDPVQDALRLFAADALARAGDAVVPQLLAILADPHATGTWPCAIRALGRSQTADPGAVAALLAFLHDSAPAKAGLRNDVIEALGLLKARDAVPALLPILDQRDEAERGAAVVALGRIGDARAVEPLVKQFDVRYSTVVVYWLKGALDQALRSITGRQGIVGGYEWKQWWLQQARAGTAPGAKADPSTPGNTAREKESP